MQRSALVIVLILAASGVAAKECRLPADAPPGVRVAPGKGCEAPKPKAFSEERLVAGREPGFVDLGNGSSLRVSGRVRVDVSGRR